MSPGRRPIGSDGKLWSKTPTAKTSRPTTISVRPSELMNPSSPQASPAAQPLQPVRSEQVSFQSPLSGLRGETYRDDRDQRHADEVARERAASVGQQRR